MGDTVFRNVINGERSTPLSGETYDVIDPTTGEIYAQAAMSGRGGRRPCLRARPTRPSRAGATRRRRSGSRRCSRSPTRSRSGPRRSCAVESKDTGKPLGLTMSEEMPARPSDQIRFFAGAARVLEGTLGG